jgi:hypothetical protein
LISPKPSVDSRSGAPSSCAKQSRFVISVWARNDGKF